jgi:hypothetical protein
MKPSLTDPRSAPVRGTAATASSRACTRAAAAAAIVRLVAVGAPVALDLAGVHVDDRDALVAVSVGDVASLFLLSSETFATM